MTKHKTEDYKISAVKYYLSGFLEEFPKSKFTCLEIGKP
jgi:hypothetical protein